MTVLASQFAVVLAVGMFVGAVSAQDEGKPKAAKEVQKTEEEKSQPQAQPQPQPELELARIIGEEKKAKARTSPEKEGGEKQGEASQGVSVRCFASLRSPAYEDRLRVGSAVHVGPQQGEFRRVQLPLGVIGYVHKKLCSPPEKGLITTLKSQVSFRYRPVTKRAEAPVQSLPQGSTLRYLGEKGDWWKVRYQTDSAYLHIKEIQVVAEPDETLRKSQEELAQRQRGEWAEATAARVGIEAKAKKLEQDKTNLADIRRRFGELKQRALAEQSYASLLSELGKLHKGLELESPLLAESELLQSEIERRSLLVNARLVLEDKSPSERSPVPTLPKAAPRDDLLSKRYQKMGWLRLARRAQGLRRYRLERGGRLVAYILCSSGRFELDLFDGVEVGVSGSPSVGGTPAVPLIDIAWIEVLNTSG